MEAIKFIQSFSNPFFDTFFFLITYLGGQTLGIFVFLFLYWFKDKKLGQRFLYGIVFSYTLNNTLKGLFNSPRPIGTPGINSSQVNTATGTSFPSGHSQGNAATLTLLVTAFKNKWVYIFSGIMFILVPLSRLYFGVHWPKDVIFGSLFGIIAIFISNKLFNLYNTNGSKVLWLSIIPFLIFSTFMESNDFFKSLGSFLGCVLSIYLETKYINFCPISSKKQNILKLLIGILGTVIIYLLINMIGSSFLISFIKYFCIVVYVVLISPFIFVKLKLSKVED